MAKGKERVNQERTKTEFVSKRKKTILLSCMGLLLITLVVSFVVAFDNGKSRAEELPKELEKYELNGSENEVRATLISLMAKPTGEFIYIYEPGCEECSRMNSLLFPLAEEKGITISRLNIVKYKDLMDLVDLDNISLPTIIYYSSGHKIGFISGSQEDEHYSEFLGHFHLHHEKHPEGEREQKGETKEETEKNTNIN